MTPAKPTPIMLNDGRELTLSWLGADDRPRFEAFCQSLGDGDLMCLHQDLGDHSCLDQWFEEVGGPGFHLLAAIDQAEGGRVAGYAFLRRGRFSASHRAMVESLVHPDYRSLGLGSAMLRQVAALGLSLELMFLEAEVPVIDRDLIDSYKRLGFELKAILEDYRLNRLGDPYDVIILMKRTRQAASKEFFYRY